MVTSVHSFIQQIFTECPVCTRLPWQSLQWAGEDRQQTRWIKNKQDQCICLIYLLVSIYHPSIHPLVYARGATVLSKKNKTRKEDKGIQECEIKVQCEICTHTRSRIHRWSKYEYAAITESRWWYNLSTCSTFLCLKLFCMFEETGADNSCHTIPVLYPHLLPYC